MTSLRDLPAVDRLLQSPSGEDAVAEFGHALSVAAAREVLEQARVQFQQDQTLPDEQTLLASMLRQLQRWTTASLVPVINATGVVIHTNLGRSPLSPSARAAMNEAAQSYSNLEFDLAGGKRGSRFSHAESLLQRLTGAEAALVVNNNAAAVMLVLSALAKRRKVVISRTQLIEIGGGFRIPDVMKQSGAILHEVGTTNRVHLYDYEGAIAEHSIAVVLTVHRSNFSLAGFTSEPSRAELAALAEAAGLPYVEDLGSGTLLETTPFGLDHEPTVSETLASGVDLVTFSGDKLLGGPQAGIIAGRADLVAKCKKHPLTRAIRPDKTTIAALKATLTHYLKDEALKQVPIWRMISSSETDLSDRAQAWRKALIEAGADAERLAVIPGKSTVGGGSLPGQTLPTHLLAIRPRSARRLLADLRSSRPAIVARAQDGQIVLDPRTVLPEEDPLLLGGLTSLLETP
jgi:L-seryl-tRNA(Ser) seleniumtransferase